MDLIILLVGPSNTCNLKKKKRHLLDSEQGKQKHLIMSLSSYSLFLGDHIENSFHVVYKVVVPWRARVIYYR